jgi:cytochrome P450
MFQFRLGPTRMVGTTEPALIDEILRARPETLRRPTDTDVILRELGMNGVFNAEGEDWRLQRRLAVSVLTQRNLRQLFSQRQFA